MFWADKYASEIVSSGKYKPYWVDDMKTPSGRVHVGALRGVVVHDLAYKALKDRGAKAKFTYVFEDHDPMDDIPSYLPKEKFEKYLGMPLFAIPSPVEGYENYARYFALEFQKVFNAIGCEPEIIWTKDLYTSGKMNPLIKEVLDKAGEVRKIYEELYKKPLPKDWYPFQVYCPSCGKVSTTKVSDWDGEKVRFECVIDKVKFTKGCGEKGKISPFSDDAGIVGKLPWKVEWPCKWKAIGVTVEGAGKDHMSKGGSHDLAELICERVINFPVPYPIAYEWLLIGGRKMSSSRGVGTAAIDMLDILPPELIRFLMVRIKVNTQINFDPSDPQTIPSLFDDYQKAYQDFKKDPKSESGRIFELSHIDGIKQPPMDGRFWNLVQWVQMPNMEDEINKAGFSDWAKYAKIYVERFAADDIRYDIKKELPEKTRELSKEQKNYLAFVGKQLDKDWEADEFQKKLYEWAKEKGISSTEAFSAIYLSFLNKDYGPKAAWIILKEDKDFVKKRFEDASK